MSEFHSTERKKKRRQGSPPAITCDEAPCPNRTLSGPCHIFRFGTTSGYGNVRHMGKHVLVHRYVWEREVGPVPEDLEVDHQCRVRRCCNVEHLRVVTRRVNRIENSDSVGAVNKNKTHCPAGHPYDEIKKNGWRDCSVCRRARGRASAERYRKKIVTVKRPHPMTLKTHCKYGHPYDAENTRINKCGSRQCKTCERIRYEKGRKA